MTAQGDGTSINLTISGVPPSVARPIHLYTFVYAGSCAKHDATPAYVLNDTVQVNAVNSIGLSGPFTISKAVPVPTVPLRSGEYAIVLRTSPADGNWDVGGLIETQYGIDAAMMHSNGLFDYDYGAYRNHADPEYQFDLTQLYLDVAVPVGKFSFEESALVENGNAVIEAVVRARPATAKGRFLEGVTISATMSPGVRVDPAPYLNI